MTDSDPELHFSWKRWAGASGAGFAISLAVWLGGEFALVRMPRTGGTMNTIVRVVLAGLEGFGLGFTLLFAMTLAAGLLYGLLNRR